MTTIAAISAQEPVAGRRLLSQLSGPWPFQPLLLTCSFAERAEAAATAILRSSLCGARACGQADGCGSCPGCRKVDGGNHANVVAPEPKPRGLPVAEVRELAKTLRLGGRDGRRKIAWLRGADQLNAAAQNALLKLIEEPPPEVAFVLTARRLHGILPTLRSRLGLLHLHGSSEAEGQEAMARAQVPAELTALAALILGVCPDDATAWQPEGAAVEAFARLKAVLTAGDDAAAITSFAEGLQARRNEIEPTLLLLEAGLRDALVVARGARASLARLPALLALLANKTESQLALAADAMLSLRSQGRAPINVPLALEGIVHVLAQSHPSATPSQRP